jgi:hypothetical protein
VVNYLLKIGDHTTPPWDDISLTNVGPAAVASARSNTGRASLPTSSSIERAPKRDTQKFAISSKPQKFKSAKISFLGIQD